MMRCYAYNCRNNDDGYCEIDSYITITEDGECDSMLECIKENEKQSGEQE